MKINFLQADRPLTKTYSKTPGGIVKTPYPFCWEFTSHEESFNNLSQLTDLLRKHAALGHCALKGALTRQLVNESRAGSTDTNSPTEWIVLDLDGLPEMIKLRHESDTNRSTMTNLTVDLFLDAMGLKDISYIVQYSASYGIENHKLRAHIFMLLDKAYAAPMVKQWLIQKNHEVELLHDAMGLTKSGNAISWPLDISACQNDKLIYIAPPVLKGIKDPVGSTRIIYVKKKRDVVQITEPLNGLAKNRDLTHRRMDELRDAAGLPKKKIKYKVVGSQEVMLAPDEAMITETKTERGFVYFNLNGGDSWAYYHPEDNPNYILNFKGEPAYLTKELLPDYWNQLTNRGTSTRTSSSGLMYLAFCDRKTGVYWRGTYEPSDDKLDINPAKNETQLRHFAKQYGVPIGDFVPEWDLIFDPADMVRVDVQNRTVNRFQPTHFMLNTGRAPKTMPKEIARVLMHALGNDQATFNHFVNWLATVLQTRDRTRTAWVLHGTEGTGKGIFVNRVLRQILGTHLTSRRMAELNERYNHYMVGALMVFIDEIQTRSLENESGVMADMRNFITEEMVPIRQMYANGVEVRNYSNWIFSSNMPDPISIKKGDRRFNIGKYQPNKLEMTDETLERIDKEVQAFYDYLINFNADYELAGTVLQSEDRDKLINISESSADQVGEALLQGNFDFFIDQLPTDDSYKRNAQAMNKVMEYVTVLKSVVARMKANGQCNIAREELRTLYDYTVGNMPQTPNKFTSLLKHHRIHLIPVWINNGTVRGLTVTWSDAHGAQQALEAFLAPAASTPAKKPSAKKAKAAA
jgi:hypothetical protein